MELPFDKEFTGRGWDHGSLLDGTDKCGHAVCWKRGGGDNAGAIGSGQEYFANSNGARWRRGRPPPVVILGAIIGAVSPSGHQGGQEGGGGGEERVAQRPAEDGSVDRGLGTAATEVINMRRVSLLP